MQKQPIYAYEFQGVRHDAGDKLGFLKATVEFGLKNGEFGDEFRDYLKISCKLNERRGVERETAKGRVHFFRHSQVRTYMSIIVQKRRPVWQRPKRKT